MGASVPFVLAGLLLVLLASGALAQAAGPVQYDAPVRERTVGPEDVALFPVDATNLGDAPVQIRFEVYGTTGDLTVPRPSSVRLDPGATAAFSFTAIAPARTGRMDERGAFQVEATPFALEGGGGSFEGTVLAFEVRTKGLHVPAAPVSMLALVVAGAAGGLAALRSRAR